MAGPGALTPLHECATSDALRCAELLAPLAREAATVASKELEEALNGAMEVDQQVGDGGWGNAKRDFGEFMGILSNYINGELGCMLRIYGVYILYIYIFIYLNNGMEYICYTYLFVGME